MNKDSTQDALYAEIGTYEKLDGINFVTDARHGWHTNANDTSVVAIGEHSHKVIDCVHITKPWARYLSDMNKLAL